MTVARSVGLVLGGVFFLFAKARAGSRKALHPRGRVVPGVLRRQSSSPASGVAWLDEVATDQVLVRFSRSIGLPTPLPDILGLALRVPSVEGRPGDLLLASTGIGRVGRFLLRPARRYADATYSCLFPYRTTSGPVLLAAFPTADRVGQLTLAWSRPTGTWLPFATLEVATASLDGTDPEVSFDPVLNVVPGLAPYGWAAELRQYAYGASRRARRTASVAPR